MPIAVSGENLNEVCRILKNAHRVARACQMSGSGAISPLYTNTLKSNPGSIADIKTMRTTIAATANVLAAAQAIVANVSDYIE